MKKSDEIKLESENIRILRSKDKRCWIYQEFQEGGFFKGKKGADRWVDVGYYGRLNDLVKYLIDRNIKVSGGTLNGQLKEILVELKRIEQTLVKELEVKLHETK